MCGVVLSGWCDPVLTPQDLHFAALECGEKVLAEKARELAANLLVSNSVIGKAYIGAD